MNQMQKVTVLMELRHTNVAELARGIGTSKQAVDYWFSVGRIPKDEWNEKVSEYFGVVPESLRNDGIDLVRRPDAVIGLDTLTSVIRVTEAYLLMHGLELKPDAKARLITLVYDAVLLVGARNAQAVTRVVKATLVRQKTGS